MKTWKLCGRCETRYERPLVCRCKWVHLGRPENGFPQSNGYSKQHSHVRFKKSALCRISQPHSGLRRGSKSSIPFFGHPVLINHEALKKERNHTHPGWSFSCLQVVAPSNRSSAGALRSNFWRLRQHLLLPPARGLCTEEGTDQQSRVPLKPFCHVSCSILGRFLLPQTCPDRDSLRLRDCVWFPSKTLFCWPFCSILGGFLAAAAKTCPDLETLCLSLQLTVQRQEDFDEDMSESDDDDAPLYFADSDAWGRDYTDYEDEMDSDADLHFGSMRPPGMGGVMKCVVDEEMDEGEHDILDDSDFPPSDETYGSDDNGETLPGEGADDGGRGRAAGERSWFDGGGGNAFGGLGLPSPGLVERLFGESNDTLGFPVFDSPDSAKGEAEASEKGGSHSEEEGGGVARIPGAIDAGVALPGGRSKRNGDHGKRVATRAATRRKVRARARARRASKMESSSDESEDGDSDESAPGDEAAAAGVNGFGALRGLGASNRQSGAEKEKEPESVGRALRDPFTRDLVGAVGAGLSTGEAAQSGRPIGDAAGGIGDRQVGNPLWERAQEEKYYADIERKRGRVAAIDARRLNFWERRADGRKAALKALAMPLMKDFSAAVKKVLEGCRSLRVLELPCGKVAHFRTRHENLQSLTLDGMAEIAYSESLLLCFLHLKAPQVPYYAFQITSYQKA
jgi:hypothetical protein